MKTGDKVKISDKNTNPFNNGVDAYAGMEGIVTDIYEDGAFCLNCGNSILVVPMNNAYKKPKKGIWIWLNGEHIFHKRINTAPKTLYNLGVVTISMLILVLGILFAKLISI